jgi:hypothetical protein
MVQLKKTTTLSSSTPISLGENPVNAFHAREYAKESSPSIVAVILELTENARDNGTDVTLTIDVESHRAESARTLLRPKRIMCTDNGTGLTHREFLEKFCGAYSESESHHEIDRAGRNGVGTKTYLSIADRALVTTTTGRSTDGLDKDREVIAKGLPEGVLIPKDGEPDRLWRVYEFRLHTRSVWPNLWYAADELEMGTQVELCDLHEGTELPYEVLLERMSYAREWLQNPSHSFTIQLTGNVPTSLPKRLVVKPWTHPIKNWLVEATGNSDEDLAIFDPTTKETEKISSSTYHLAGRVEFDFRVVGRTADGHMQNLERPALLLEICGALPYPPNLEGVQSARTLPLLTFMGLEHASSIGAFCNAVCGYARINALPLKQALRNNKTTLVSGPGAEAVEGLRQYLHTIFKSLHRAWYNATRSSQDEAARDALREAEEEVNLALKGVNRNPFREGVIQKSTSDNDSRPVPPPPRRHRWECGSCGKRWLAIAGFSPKACAETSSGSGIGKGCGSTNIGLSKNQPRIGDCQIRIEQLGDRRLPAIFQFDHVEEDLDVPVVRINLTSPRYIELRGAGSMSGQAQKRLKQYLVDVSLVGIAEYHAKTRGTDFSEELGDLYFNRMLRSVGIKTYESQLTKVLADTNGLAEEAALVE